MADPAGAIASRHGLPEGGGDPRLGQGPATVQVVLLPGSGYVDHGGGRGRCQEEGDQDEEECDGDFLFHGVLPSGLRYSVRLDARHKEALSCWMPKVW